MYSEFIKQTALDYDIEEYIIEKIYLKYYESGTFYDELEKFISNRSNYLF